jgi:hypothetical protein
VEAKKIAKNKKMDAKSRPSLAENIDTNDAPNRARNTHTNSTLRVEHNACNKQEIRARFRGLNARRRFASKQSMKTKYHQNLHQYGADWYKQTISIKTRSTKKDPA